MTNSLRIVEDYSSLFATVRTVRTIRCSRLFAIRVFQTPTIIVDPLSSMASAFDVKSNCSRSSVGTQSLNNLLALFPSTSFTIFVIGSALDFGAFRSGTRARLISGGKIRGSGNLAVGPFSAGQWRAQIYTYIFLVIF